MISSTFGINCESPYVDEPAKTNLFIPLFLDATSIFKNPLTFTSLDVIGSLIDLGTDPNAA